MKRPLKRTWVPCPICGESDMERTEDRDGNALISCVNHACASNGGTNCDALAKSAAPDSEPTRIQLNPDGTWNRLD